MKEIAGKKVILTEGEFLRREEANKRYLMKLETPYLLRSYLHEAGRYSGRGPDAEAFGGWEDLSCQLRGHFLGHWLSAAALHYQETEDVELKAKTEVILKELELCQKDNGGEWVCPIPEKYLYWIGKGRNIWAPQYNIHKLFMGLIDVYRMMEQPKALSIADKLADWFYRWSGRYTREEFDDILDMETGGMLEVWADLYEITGQEKYKILMQLLMWGIEGTNWNMEDGKHVPNDDLIEGFQTDFDKTQLDTGVRKWTWFVKNGNGTDGTPYDVTLYKVKETRQVAMNHFGENDRWDTAEFTGLTPAGSTPDGLKWQKIQDIYDQEYPKIVNADSHDAAMEEYDKMISEMNDAGLEDVEKVITQNYQERMKLWNE